jgi:dihydroorotate dehydrogenase (NAD+) catalytic subunit
VAVDLSVTIGQLELKNPVMLASGCCGYGDELSRFVDLSDLGAIMVKGTTREPREGNPPPRIAETPSGLLNSIGLQNPGVEGVIEHKLPWLAELGVPVIVNVSGATLEDYVYCAQRLADDERAHALELNVSCPNVKQGGILFGTDACALADVTRAVREAFPRTLIVKLTPNVTDIAAMARAAEEAGADALSSINTLVGMTVDVRTRRPGIHTTMGGLSGPAIRPVAVRCTYLTAQAVDIPVIGMGGISTAQDALEFFIVGARAVAVGTASLVDPLCYRKVLEGIRTFCSEEGAELDEIISSVRTWDS